MVKTSDVRDYIGSRKSEGAANATINRELAALKRAYTLGVQAEKITNRSHIPMLEEHNVRQGFFERGQFETVRRLLPDYLRPVITFMYVTGWRSISEVFPLHWHQVDLETGTVRLEPGTTKNREGRVFYLTRELRDLLEARETATEAPSRASGRIIPYVFHRGGQPIPRIYTA
jgi:integrase